MYTILSAPYLLSSWGLMPEGGRVGWLNASVNFRSNAKGTPTWTGEGTTPTVKAAALLSERTEIREYTWACDCERYALVLINYFNN